MILFHSVLIGGLLATGIQMNQNEHNESPLPGPTDIDAVLAFMPIFETPGFMFSTPDGELSDDAIRFVNTLNKHGFIRSSFNWPEWQHEAERYLNEPTAIESADLETICRLFTTHVRKDRFCEGHLAGVYQMGAVNSLLRQLAGIRAALSIPPAIMQYEIDTTVGFHKIKRQFRKEYIATQCFQLLANFGQALKATVQAAPVRNDYFEYLRDEAGSPAGEEHRWERGIWRQWQKRESVEARDVWRWILTYQENLPAAQQAQGWGEIDLVGVTNDGGPIVIELKAPNPNNPAAATRDSPVAMAIQAAAYAIALKKAWPRFQEKWRRLILTRFGVSYERHEPESWPIRCVAPDIYWHEWIGQTPRAKTVSREAWVATQLVCEMLKAHSMPVEFVSLNSGCRDQQQIPESIEATIVRLPNCRTLLA